MKLIKRIRRRFKKAKNRRRQQSRHKSQALTIEQRDLTRLKPEEFEFILRRKHLDEGEDPDDFYLVQEQWTSVLTPASKDWTLHSDKQGFAIKIDDYTYGINEEFAGLQIGFEGNVTFSIANSIVEELKEQLESHSGLEAEVVVSWR